VPREQRNLSRAILPVFSAVLFCLQAAAQESSDPVAQALSQGDLYASRRKYELALDAYHKADKFSPHFGNGFPQDCLHRKRKPELSAKH
jgi:hypothetical protein